LSLILSSKKNSPIDLVCRTEPAGYLSFDSIVRIGDYEIESSDFCQLIEYFFRNFDIEQNDERLNLLNHLRELEIVDGFEKGKKRLGIK
jgi:hypothetical protein